MTAPSHAVVIGASIAGLLAAAALSGACPRVTLFERDTLPAEPGPRRGVPQTRQLHALQARGVQALDELLPGLRDELVAAGGVLADMQGDIHWYLDDYLLKTARTGLEGIGISRPLLEWLIRSRVAALPGVTITDATDVVGLVTADDHVTGVTVRAARTRDAAEETIAADLVIDAAGAGSRIPAWLPQLGLEAPRTTRVRAGVTYVTRMYRRDQKQLDGRFGSLVTPYPGRPFGGAVLRQEGERWVVLLAGMVGTEPPLDEDGMIAFADQFACGDIAAVMRESAPLTEPLKYTYPESARNHYEKLGGRLGGLLVIGDAYCGFNPIYGQGITIAALEALILRRLLGADRRQRRRRQGHGGQRRRPGTGLLPGGGQAGRRGVGDLRLQRPALPRGRGQAPPGRRADQRLRREVPRRRLGRPGARRDVPPGREHGRQASEAAVARHRAARLPVGGEGGTRGAWQVSRSRSEASYVHDR